MKVALLGLGTVGRGAYDIILDREKEIELALGEPLEISHILCRKERMAKGYKGVPMELLTDDYNEIIDGKVDVVVEVTGQMELAFEYMKKALENGIAVVTANKAVISAYYEELMAIAEKTETPLLFEAAVGGGIPVLTPLRQLLVTNEVSSISGILNGTCNYLLNKMFNDGAPYDETLKLCQDLGYAEQDPTDDVEGFDTMRKLRILTTMAIGRIKEEDILLRGISAIGNEDIQWCKDNNKKVKLIAKSGIVDGGLVSVVEPVILEATNSLAALPEAINAVHIVGDSVGEVEFQGPGAGKEPTGNAIVADILDVLSGSGYALQPKAELPVNNDTFKAIYYVRGAELPEDLISEKTGDIQITKEVLRSEVFKYINEETFVARIEH